MSTTYAVGQRLTATILQALADATVNRPVCRLIQQSAQSLADNADTALVFGAGSEDVDTSGAHDEVTNNTRITPTKAGYYTFYALLFVVAATDYVNLQIYVKKNATTILPSSSRQGPNATSGSRSVQIVVPSIPMNGTTDFMEAFGNQDSSGSHNTASSGSNTSCLFGMVYERDL